MTPVYKILKSGVVTITVTGHAVALPLGSSNRIDIQALSTNASSVIVGDNSITNLQSGGGIALVPNQVYNLEKVTSPNMIFVNGASGDGISFNYWIGESY